MNSPFVRATRTHVLVLAVLVRGAAGSSGMEPPPETAGTNAAMTPEMTIQDWPEVSRAAARAMIAQYGEPQLGY